MQCFGFYWTFSCSLHLSRVPPLLLRQQTTIWFVPPEWGDKPRQGVRLSLHLQKTRPRGNNLWCLITCTTSMYPWSPSVLSSWTPLRHPAQLMVSSSDGCGPLSINLKKKKKSRQVGNLSFFLFCKGSRAGLGSSPSMEGPMDPSGPTEYTEQTLDTDSQVGIIYSFLISAPLFFHKTKIDRPSNL